MSKHPTWFRLLCHLILSLTLTHAYTPCPLLGPSYPAPTDLTSPSSALNSAWTVLSAKIEQYLSNDTGEPTGPRAHSFSIGLLSIHDASAAAQWQQHHSGTSLVSATNTTQGTRRVTGDSTYRMASLTKLMTVYLFVTKLGNEYWHRRVVEFVPELLKSGSNSSFTDPIGAESAWQDITLGALAGQISGVARDVPYGYTDLAARAEQDGGDPASEGFPAIDQVVGDGDFPICGPFIPGKPACNTSAFIAELQQMAPTFEPWTTPVYANPPYALLALALERIVGNGSSFGQLMQTSIFHALNLSDSTSYDVPPESSFSNGVIPYGDASAVMYSSDVGAEKPVYGLFSSLNDMVKIGVGILNSTLMPQLTTREWMKPIAHTANANYSVGRPWEIYRLSLPVSRGGTGKLLDLYAKDGNLGNYTSRIALSQDHGAGFVILVAGPLPESVLPVLEDAVSGTILPALEAQAAAEANSTFAGTYSYQDTSNLNSSIAASTSKTSTLNSSLTIAPVDPSTGPGLVISSWTCNGTDMLSVIARAYGLQPGSLDVRLYPTNLGSSGSGRKSSTGTRRIAFRAVFGTTDDASTTTAGAGDEADRLFSSADACAAWSTVDAIYYARRALDSFVFEVDGDDGGRAISVTPAATRAKLVRM